MTENWPFAVATVAIFGALFSIVCRIGHMHKGVTRTRVFLQHLVLGSALAGALVLPRCWSLAALAVGVHVYLTMGAARWRDGAPADTRNSQWNSN
jgi:hypothetical protein